MAELAIKEVLHEHLHGYATATPKQSVVYCINDPCDSEATTTRGPRNAPYCYTCSEAYDAGFEEGLAKEKPNWN